MKQYPAEDGDGAATKIPEMMRAIQIKGFQYPLLCLESARSAAEAIPSPGENQSGWILPYRPDGLEQQVSFQVTIHRVSRARWDY